MSSYRRLILFVEGNDDQRFAESIIVPLLESQYSDVEVHECAQKLYSKVRSFIRVIKRIDYWDYLFIADFDQGPCVTFRKDQLVSRYNNLDTERILIVRREIESWYLAGLNLDSCAEFEVPFLSDTNDVSKEGFNGMIPSHFLRADFMVEILKRYDIGTARSKNTSFNYAITKHFSAIV